ncbi:hypothetical protein niasHS_007035 [Heterodera schachtii]|uniref:Uncharacterized protein n=1 Tax=Heterodera schachtii TaxID=97005 RepID=A0ABD2JFB3_HETSC
MCGEERGAGNSQVKKAKDETEGSPRAFVAKDLKDGRTDNDEEEENQKPVGAQQAHIPQQAHHHTQPSPIECPQPNWQSMGGNGGRGRTTDGRGTPGEGHKVKTAPEGMGGREGKKSLGGGGEWGKTVKGGGGGREKLRFHSMWVLGGGEGMMGILPERNEGREAERGEQRHKVLFV